MSGRRWKLAYIRRHEIARDNVQPTVPPESCTPVFGPSLPVGARVEQTLAALSLEEKITMLGGVDSMGIHGVPRLGLQRVWCSDASAGVRNFGPGTAFAAPVALAASWNRDLVRRVASAIGEECRAVGVSILLGPGVNIARVPTCGRNFEYLGEDPFLASELAVSYIEGVQSRGVAATVKHFACNNSEYDRHRMNAIVDERTLREIYLPAFRAAVQRAGTHCLMSSYNPVNGAYASENRTLLRDLLRKAWDFRGIVMSDWNSVYSTRGPLEAGMDLEMPRGVFYSREQIEPLIHEGRVPVDLVDEKIRRLLTVFYGMGFYDRPTVDSSCTVGGDAHLATALEAARQGIVLLKNQGGLLPLDPHRVRRIALLGRNATETPTGGGGSSRVRAANPISLEQGLRQVLPSGCQVVVVADRHGRISGADARRLRDSDAVVACVGFDYRIESESYDRRWRLPDGQARLVRRACALNRNTVVVLTAGGDVETQSWVARVPALLHTFYLGERSGQAIAEALVGANNPSGKLPFSMARRWSDHAGVANYVRRPERTSKRLTLGPRARRLVNDWPAARLERLPRERRDVRYAEGVFVGYRHFDSRDIEPQFAFGHGLSYTTFELSGMRLSSPTMRRGEELTVAATVRNCGCRAGAEVVQLYVEDLESSVERPRKELKAFERVALQAGESREVALRLGEEALSFYDPLTRSWVAEPGRFRLHLGSSSRAIAGNVELEYLG